MIFGYPVPTKKKLSRWIKPKLLNMHFFRALFYFILFFIFYGPRVHAQIILRNLSFNGVQFEARQLNDKKISSRDYLKKTTTSDTIDLPFLDDFSSTDLVWAPGRFYYSDAIYWIGFFSNQNARAFGKNGLHVKTANKGRIWEKVSGLNSETVLSASFIDRSAIGWSCGKNGWLAKTLDSGQNWIKKISPSSLPNSSLKQVKFRSGLEGLVVDSLGKIFRTGDGGENWVLGQFPGSADFSSKSVDWVNASVAVAVGDSAKTAISSDGGLTWEVQNHNVDKAKNFRKVRMFDGIFGLAVGDSGIIYRTVNAGLTWDKSISVSVGNLLDVDFSDSNKNICWAVGTEGTIMSSINMGSTWVQVNSGFEEDFLCLDLVENFRGFIGSENGRILQLLLDLTKPESSYWEKNSGVFINNTFSYKPISIGVATFDGLNNQGLPYSNQEKKYGPCDTLSSVGINLGNSSLDGVYLSFWFQQGGKVVENLPNPGDSLVVQFRGPSKNWHSAWNVNSTSKVGPTNFKFN